MFGAAFVFLFVSIHNNSKNSIRDASMPKPGETVFNTMRYRCGETVQRSEYFHSSVSYIKIASAMPVPHSLGKQFSTP